MFDRGICRNCFKKKRRCAILNFANGNLDFIWNGNNKMKRTLVISILLMLGGCASIAPEQITPRDLLLDQIEGKSNVRVSGSNEQIIKNEDLKLAVESAILSSQLFSGMGRNLNVNVSVLSIKNPMFGMDLTAEARVRWQIFNADSKEEIFNSVFSSSHTSTVGDHVVAVQRLKMANQEALRKNIEMALKAISKDLTQ
jgi:hypothetical protein